MGCIHCSKGGGWHCFIIREWFRPKNKRPLCDITERWRPVWGLNIWIIKGLVYLALARFIWKKVSFVHLIIHLFILLHAHWWECASLCRLEVVGPFIRDREFDTSWLSLEGVWFGGPVGDNLLLQKNIVVVNDMNEYSYITTPVKLNFGSFIYKTEKLDMFARSFCTTKLQKIPYITDIPPALCKCSVRSNDVTTPFVCFSYSPLGWGQTSLLSFPITEWCEAAN